MLLFSPIFCKVSSLIYRCRPLTHFSITNLLSIYNYWLTLGIFNISAISMILCLFSLHLMKIFAIAHLFWNKNIAKHCITMINELETTINTKFTTVNHYFTNCKTKSWLWKEGMIVYYERPDVSSSGRPKFFSSIKK